MLPAKDRDSSLFTQEYAKELFEAQGNIIYQDISRKPKATHDLICIASVLGKLKTNLCYLRDENLAMDTYAIQWRIAKCLPLSKSFLVSLSTVVSEKQFFLCGLFNILPNCKDQHLPKKRSRTKKQKNSYKKDLFVFWMFKRTSLDLN